MRTCSSCGEVKPLGDFKRDGRKPDGCSSFCKECGRRQAAEWRKRSRAHIAVYKKTRARHLPATPASNAAKKRWAAANPEKMRVHWRNKHARKRAAEGKYTHKDIAGLMAAQRGKCAYCRDSLRPGYHVDHIHPLSRGGSNWPRNLQLLCKTCNLAKCAKDPIVFSQEMGLLL